MSIPASALKEKMNQSITISSPVPRPRAGARRYWLGLLLGGLLGAIPVFAQERVLITILHTNDHHGHFLASESGEYGLAARKTLVDKIRKEVRAQGGVVLLLDSGDVNTGTPESDSQEAEPDFIGMSMIGYDAMAVGNHEFDKPIAALRRQRWAWSSFPWLSANVYANGQRMFDPYRIIDTHNVKIALLGLTTDDTRKTISAEQHPEVSITAPIDEARALVPSLRSKAAIVIALTHMGHYADGKRGVNAPGDVELARGVSGVDIIVGGHSHNPVCMLAPNVRDEAYTPGKACMPDVQNGTWIVQASEWGKYLGRADFEYSRDGLRLLHYQLIPVNLRRAAADARKASGGDANPAPIAEDPGLLHLLKGFQIKGQADLALPIGQSDGVFIGERSQVRYKPTNLGKLVAQSMIEKTGADLAILSSGGLRDSLPAGSITYRDLRKVLPFGNHLYLVSMSGAELLAYLEKLSAMTPGSGAYPQFAGVEFQAETGPGEVKVKGLPVAATGVYRLALNSFNIKGGDGYPPLLAHPAAVNTGYLDTDALKDFILRRKLVQTADFAATP